MAELLTFTIYFAFLRKPIWGNASVSRYYRSPCPDIIWETASPRKYLEERRSQRSLDYTTCDGCYFQIHKLQYLCNANVTFFKIVWTDIWSYIWAIKQLEYVEARDADILRQSSAASVILAWLHHWAGWDTRPVAGDLNQLSDAAI